MNRDHGYGSKYDQNRRIVAERKARKQANSAKHTPTTSAALPAVYRLISICCALLLIFTGVYLVAAVVTANGFRSHFRVVIITQLAESIFRVLQSENTSWNSV